MFAAHAEAQEPGGYVALPWELAAPLDGALDATEAGGVDDDVQGVAETVSGGRTAICAFGTPSATSLRIRAQSSKVITPQSSRVFTFQASQLSSFRAAPTLWLSRRATTQGDIAIRH